jgi:L-rhamnose isomerase / sugar isomerase
MTNWESRYAALCEDAGSRCIDLPAVERSLKSQRIETPSWGYADSGTRFGAFRMAGAPTTVREKLLDAAQAHKFTGIAPTVALHIPWDTVDDWSELSRYAASLGLTIGAINPNLFQENEYRFGSLTAESPAVRKRAIAHVRECIEIMRAAESKALSIWLADGTNFPGQSDFRSRKRRLSDCLVEIHSGMKPSETLLIEYKPFEPAFYHTDIADWGMAYTLCAGLGPNAKVLVDLGHHLHGANIEHIVAFLVDEHRLGGFHFNNRKYADDDLTSGSINPYELFLIFTELVKAERDGLGGEIAYMIDESHGLKNKIAEMIQSLVALQTAYAKALLVDYKKLARAQQSEDLVGCEEIIKDAFAVDVRPLLWKVRSDLGLPDPTDPVAGFRASGYAEEAAAERGIGRASGLGA